MKGTLKQIAEIQRSINYIIDLMEMNAEDEQNGILPQEQEFMNWTLQDILDSYRERMEER